MLWEEKKLSRMSYEESVYFSSETGAGGVNVRITTDAVVSRKMIMLSGNILYAYMHSLSIGNVQHHISPQGMNNAATWYNRPYILERHM